MACIELVKMAIYERLVVCGICICTCLLTQDRFCAGVAVPSVEYHISLSNDTWENSNSYCELAQLGNVYNYTTGKLFLQDRVQQRIPSTGVWIGYFKAFTEFEYKGCGQTPNSSSVEVIGLAECHHHCGGKSFGLVENGNKIYCRCVESLTNISLIDRTCYSFRELVVGRGNVITAIYTPLLGESNQSLINNTNNTSMHCKTSVTISRSSATYQWSLCKNITDQRVWCKLNGSSPFLPNKTFDMWNDATDYCAKRSALPSSANGYNDTPAVTTPAFTNIRREWTLHLANGSFSGKRMFAYIANGSTEIQFSNSSSGSYKTGLCLVRPSTTSTATSTIEISSPTTSLESQTTVTPTSSNNSTTTSTTDTTLTNAISSAAFEESSRGSSISAIAAGVSVAVAIVVTAVVIVLVLRKKRQLCFKNTKGSKLENTDDNNQISLERTESNSNANFINLGAPVFNHTYSCLQNTGTKDIDAFNYILDNKQNGSYLGPDALVSSHSYCGQHTISEMSYQNINRKQGLAKSDANSYFVLEKDGLDKKRNATTPVSADVHDYFVLEKQQSAVGNVNGASINEIHPYFVLEKQGDQPAREMPSNEANPYFILEKQTACNSTTIHTANALILDTDDGNMYQEIDTNDTYAGIDNSREDNNDYDYTNKGFRDSKTEISDNLYNHLHSAGDDYDHVGTVTSNVSINAMDNNYDVTFEAVRK